eukprot:110078-Chlamydomonas_euryale.AAC.2
MVEFSGYSRRGWAIPPCWAGDPTNTMRKHKRHASKSVATPSPRRTRNAVPQTSAACKGPSRREASPLATDRTKGC